MIDDQNDPRCNPTCHSKLDHGQKPIENLENKKASKSQMREQNQQETHVGILLLLILRLMFVYSHSIKEGKALRKSNNQSNSQRTLTSTNPSSKQKLGFAL